MLEQRKDIDEERMAGLEQFIREATEAAVDSNKKCEEVCEDGCLGNILLK